MQIETNCFAIYGQSQISDAINVSNGSTTACDMVDNRPQNHATYNVFMDCFQSNNAAGCSYSLEFVKKCAVCF